ncbi:MAG: hypothetical protein AVDCRST_MAG41-3735, partial [uncultured Corynebacteriales bacterium]
DRRVRPLPGVLPARRRRRPGRRARRPRRPVRRHPGPPVAGPTRHRAGRPRQGRHHGRRLPRLAHQGGRVRGRRDRWRGRRVRGRPDGLPPCLGAPRRRGLRLRGPAPADRPGL